MSGPSDDYRQMFRGGFKVRSNSPKQIEGGERLITIIWTFHCNISHRDKYLEGEEELGPQVTNREPRWIQRSLQHHRFSLEFYLQNIFQIRFRYPTIKPSQSSQSAPHTPLIHHQNPPPHLKHLKPTLPHP
jgi:hypothetical protein